MRVRVFYHDKCFDGASSAALFSRFYQERIRNDVQFEFTGLLHRAGALFDERQFDGDENAIVDFKYSSSPKINWWFDHHESAFLSPEDAAHFEQDQGNRKFYDPDFKSCTSFIAMVAEQRFGFNAASVADLVHWTDVIDGALYEDAKTAVEMKAPAMKLTMVIESAPDSNFVPQLIPLLATKSLAEILEAPFVAPLLPPLLKRHELSIGILKERSECKDQTIFFDVTDQELEGYNKFVPYYLHPESIYSVGLSKSSFRVKVSVGSNPWAPSEPTVNLAKVCERYGGGGHARVGAISFDVTKHEDARRASFRDCRGIACGGAGAGRRLKDQARFFFARAVLTFSILRDWMAANSLPGKCRSKGQLKNPRFLFLTGDVYEAVQQHTSRHKTQKERPAFPLQPSMLVFGWSDEGLTNCLV